MNAIHCSARAVNEQYEIIVADDASTDRTAEIARSLGARVERVNYRQIAGTRNAGFVLPQVSSFSLSMPTL